jgi:hypothetical protein
MALGAVIFVFRVRTRELAWGHDGLDSLSHRPGRECNQKQKEEQLPSTPSGRA